MTYSSILTEYPWSGHAKQRFEERCGDTMCVHNRNLLSSEYVWLPYPFDHGYRICRYRNGLIVVLVLQQLGRKVITFMSNMKGATVDAVLRDIAEIKLALTRSDMQSTFAAMYRRLMLSAQRDGDHRLYYWYKSKLTKWDARRPSIQRDLLRLGTKSMSRNQLRDFERRRRHAPLGF